VRASAQAQCKGSVQKLDAQAQLKAQYEDSLRQSTQHTAARSTEQAELNSDLELITHGPLAAAQHYYRNTAVIAAVHLSMI
jgi:hypothetical protein